MRPWLALLLTLAAASPAAAETRHTVVPKDCLWNLAQHYYQNAFRWKAIYAANTNIVKDPHWIYPGQVLVIPDVPEPEVGELPARPVETAQTPAEQPVEQAPAAAPEKPAKPAGLESTPEGLSARLPPGQTGNEERVKVPEKWDADGSVIPNEEGLEIPGVEGRAVQAKLAKPAAAGDRFDVYRKGAPKEGEDLKSQYLVYIGSVKVEKPNGGSKYSVRVVRAVDMVQTGDLLRRGAR